MPSVGETRMKRSERTMYGLIDSLTERFYYYFALKEGQNEEKDHYLQELAGKIGYMINITVTLAKHQGLEMRLTKLEAELANPIPELVRRQFRNNPDVMIDTVKQELAGR